MPSILFGWILVIGSPVATDYLLPAFVVVINRRFIADEETALRQAFGDGIFRSGAAKSGAGSDIRLEPSPAIVDP